MVAIELADSGVHVCPDGWEVAGGLVGPFTVPYADIVDASAESSPLQIVKGLRVGLGLPKTRIGRWYYKGEKDYLGIRGGEPAIVLTLRPSARFTRVIVSVPDPELLCARVKSRLPAGSR